MLFVPFNSSPVPTLRSSRFPTPWANLPPLPKKSAATAAPS